jgi:hypothetical protein
MLGNYRRLSKDYERLLHNSEGMIYLASIKTMLKLSLPSNDNQTTDRSSCPSQTLTRVVLPKPAGAEIKVYLAETAGNDYCPG